MMLINFFSLWTNSTKFLKQPPHPQCRIFPTSFLCRRRSEISRYESPMISDSTIRLINTRGNAISFNWIELHTRSSASLLLITRIQRVEGKNDRASDVSRAHLRQTRLLVTGRALLSPHCEMSNNRKSPKGCEGVCWESIESI